MTEGYQLIGIAHEDIRKGDYVLRRGSELTRIDMAKESKETQRVIKKEVAEFNKENK